MGHQIQTTYSHLEFFIQNNPEIGDSLILSIDFHQTLGTACYEQSRYSKVLSS